VRTHKWYLVTFVALNILADRGLFADFRAGSYGQAGPETIHQMLPNIASSDATYDVGQYPMYEPELAAGDGKQEVETYCNTCHSPRYITMQPPLPAGAWADEVTKMVKTFGASVPGDDARKIIEYLQSHYTPETRKR
jgi:mono/diheme cytochrome c family protein